MVAGIERQYQLASASEASLRKSFNSNKAQIQDIARKEFQLREFQREVDSTRALYETFVTRLKETAATADMDSTKARIVDPAIVPLEASKPRKTLIVAIVGLVAAVIGVALALLFDNLSNTFKTDETDRKHAQHSAAQRGAAGDEEKPPTTGAIVRRQRQSALFRDHSQPAHLADVARQ